MKLLHDGVHGAPVQRLAFVQEIEQEGLDVLIYRGELIPRVPADGHVTAANHHQILHQVRMKAMANLKEKIFLFRRTGRQLRVTATELVDLRYRLYDAFGFPDGGIVMRTVQVYAAIKSDPI